MKYVKAMIIAFMTVLVCVVGAAALFKFYDRGDIGPFNVNDISSDETSLSIATDLSTGKGTRLITKTNIDGHLISMFTVYPYDGEFGIAKFEPLRMKDRYKFGSAVFSKDPIQVKRFRTKEKEVVAIGIRKESRLQKLIVKRGEEKVEKTWDTERDVLEVIHFSTRGSTNEIIVTGYDSQGLEQANVRIPPESGK